MMISRLLLLLGLLSAVTAAAAPVNDDFAAALPLGGALPLTVTGTTLEASHEAEEPPAVYPWLAIEGRRTVWWRWTVPADGWYLADVRGSAAGTDVNVFRGAGLGTLAAATARGINTVQDGRCLFEAVVGETLYVRAASDEGGAVSMTLTATPVPGRHFTAQRPKLLSGLPPFADEEPLFPLVAEEDIPAALASQHLWWEWQAPAAGQFVMNLTTTRASVVVAAWQEQAGVWLSRGSAFVTPNNYDSAPDALLLTASAGQRWRFSCRPEHDNAQDHGWSGWARLALRPAAVATVAAGNIVPLPAEGMSGDLTGWTTFRWVVPATGWYWPVAVVNGETFRTNSLLSTRIEGGEWSPHLAEATAGAVWLIIVKSSVSVGHVKPFSLRMERQPDAALADDFANAVPLGSQMGLQTRLRKIQAGREPEEHVHPALINGERTPFDSAWCRWTSPHTGVVALRAWREPEPHTVAAMWTGSPLDAAQALPVLNYPSQGIDSPHLESWYRVEAGREYWIGIYSGYAIPPLGSVQLELTPLAFAVNDAFAAALPLTGGDAELKAPALPATLEPGEPDVPLYLCDGGRDGISGTLWWRWMVPASGHLEVNASYAWPCQHSAISVHRGTALGQLTTVAPGEPLTAGETLYLRSMPGSGARHRRRSRCPPRTMTLPMLCACPLPCRWPPFCKRSAPRWSRAS
jgi:hypothetical protein